MQVFYDLSEVTKDVNSIITLGTFDGIHLGHKKIIENVINQTLKSSSRSFLVTFEPHPRNVISKGYKLKSLNSLREKLETIEAFGIENTLVINFTDDFSRLKAEEFFKKFIVDGIGLKHIVIGYDHHFGKGRGGDAETLKELGDEYGFGVTVVGKCKVGNITVSSTKIRKALEEGRVKDANTLLGRIYSFSGTVVKGDKRGRKLGFPTANIKLEDDDKLLPVLGIYAVECLIDNQKHFGLLSVGKRPTFYDSGDIVAEVYLYNFNKEIYGDFITVYLIERIRGEEKYSSADELIEQMNKDKEIGLKILNEINN